METGFPSPAQGFEEELIDFQRLLIFHPAATFCMRMNKSHPEFGIYRGDILTVDRSLTPQKNSLVVFARGGVFCCDRFFKLCNSRHEETQLFGVITNIIHRVVE